MTTSQSQVWVLFAIENDCWPVRHKRQQADSATVMNGLLHLILTVLLLKIPNMGFAPENFLLRVQVKNDVDVVWADYCQEARWKGGHGFGYYLV